MKEIKAIEARDLTKYYGDFLAVDHVSFDVEQGEIFGFLGPNGAGKSTTIRMLTGVSTPTEGTATIMGFDIVRQPVEAKSVIGIVPDISNVYTELTAWENLVFTGKLYGISKERREKRAEELENQATLLTQSRDAALIEAKNAKASIDSLASQLDGEKKKVSDLQSQLKQVHAAIAELQKKFSL